jgi:hypothetical protein
MSEYEKVRSYRGAEVSYLNMKEEEVQELKDLHSA